MQSTVKGGIRENNYFLIMDKKINDLRTRIWDIIFKNRGNLNDCDVAMALGIVQYELIHHSDEKKK